MLRSRIRRAVAGGVVALTVFAGCRRPVVATTPAAAVAATHEAPAWTRSATIYEVNVRQYTPQGTLAALQPELPRLRALGVDILWLMPVQPIGVQSRKGPLGSYYSVRNYVDVNPEFGSKADFRSLVDAAHREGMRVILDWVPNHTAFDHPWIAQHPDWYAHRPDGSISYAHDNEDRETDWTDVAELNYGNADMRRAMISDMRWWLDSMRIDGFRCDVAGGVPLDFWAQARRALTAVRPDLFMLAEAEGPQYYQSFDMTYGWELHHLLNDVAQGKKGAAALDDYFVRAARDYPRTAYRMYFTSNHDENSWSGTEFERMGANHLPAYVIAATAWQGMPLLYTGQEASFNRRLKFFEKDTVDWTGPSLASFYRAIFDLKHANAALWNGDYGATQQRLATDGGDRVYAYSRTKGSNTVLVAVNFGDASARVSYSGLAHPGTFTDWFDKSTASLGAAGALVIPAHGYRVLVR